MQNPYTTLQQCKVCGSQKLIEVLWIAPQYLSPTFVQNNSSALSQVKIPLTLVLCDRQWDAQNCGLLQLKEIVDPDLLYRRYFYRSAVSDTMRADLHEVVRAVLAHTTLTAGDFALDIGCNDCTMLSFFPQTAQRIGIDPAQNIDRSQVDPSIRVVTDYFSAASAAKLTGGKPVQVVTCTAMFYDLPDPNQFVADIKMILAPGGVWCIQLSYLAAMIENMNFYDICHEHLSYYSLETLQRLMERHGLVIFDASANNVNGGSLRVFITHRENAEQKLHTAKLQEVLAHERAMNLYAPETYITFYRNIEALITKVNACIATGRAEGKLVIGLGASTKGNVLLQLFGISKEVLPYISEKNPEKVGLRTLGTDIELISEERARKLKPSCMLVLPWYFKEEIVRRERAYLESGGKLLFPMPYAHLVTSAGEVNL